MRDPSIHITLSTFYQIAEDLNLKLSKPKIQKIFSEARNRSVILRSLNTHNKKTVAKVEKLAVSNIGDANTLAQVIYAVQVKLNYRGARKINQGDSQWTSLKSLTELLNDYAAMTNRSDRKQVYTEYVLKAFQSNHKTITNTVQYLKNGFENIIARLDADKVLREDRSPDSTAEMHQMFTAKVMELTGIATNYQSDSLDYLSFYHAKELADDLGVDYETFLDAQFDALAFCNGIPNIKDLCSEKAQERLTRYLSKNRLTLRSSKNQDIQVDWSKFKQ